MNKDVLDIEDFLERVQGDKDLLLELVDIYQEDYRERRKMLGLAIEHKQIEEIKNVAHSMKGASGNISAKALYATCMKMEQLAKENALEGLPALLADLDRHYGALQEAIAELKKQIKK